jgi:DNA replication protein DnaC
METGAESVNTNQPEAAPQPPAAPPSGGPRPLHEVLARLSPPRDGEAPEAAEQRHSERDRRIQEAYRRGVVERKLAQAGLPKLLTDLARWSEVDEHEAEAARRWLDTQPLPWLILFGAVGVGKSSLAVLLLRELAQRQTVRSLRVVHAAKLFALLTEGPAPTDIETADILLLDDLGAERAPAEWALGRFEALIDTRWAEGRVCLVTTNCRRLGMLEQRYGQPVLSRLTDTSQTRVIEWRSDRDRRTGCVSWRED